MQMILFKITLQQICEMLFCFHAFFLKNFYLNPMYINKTP